MRIGGDAHAEVFRVIMHQGIVRLPGAQGGELGGGIERSLHEAGIIRLERHAIDRRLPDELPRDYFLRIAKR